MLNVHGRRLSGAAALVIATALIAHLVLHLAPLPDIPGIYLLRDFIDPNAEQSAVTWISSVLWLIAAATAAVIANTRNTLGENDVRWWFAFAVIPLAISLDEVAAMHERLSEPVRDRLVLDGPLYFAWVIPAIIIVLALGVVFSRFLLRLPSWLRLRLVLAGGVAVAGAIGLELVGSAIFRVDEYGRQSVEYLVVTTFEEALELAGVLILISALLRYLAQHAKRITLQIVGYPEEESALPTHDRVRVDR